VDTVTSFVGCWHIFCLHRQDDGEDSMCLWNVTLLQQDYSVLYPKMLSFSYLPPWRLEISQIRIDNFSVRWYLNFIFGLYTCLCFVRFQVLTAASIMFRVVFWDILPCKMIVDNSECLCFLWVVYVSIYNELFHGCTVIRICPHRL
jgi:hypothetical protein